MIENQKPNAFVFKAFIKGEYRLCVCPRVDNHWAEKEIIYIDNPFKELYDSLDDRFFNVIFVVYEKDADKGFWIKPGDTPSFLKSESMIAQEMYSKGEFFTTIEEGYQQIYGEQTSGEGRFLPSSQEKSI